MAPKGEEWDRAVAWWRTLATDEGAAFDRSVRFDAREVAPTVTWGTSPEDVVPITGYVPDPDSFADPAKREAARKSLDYMGLHAGQRMQDVAGRARLHRQLHQQPDRGSCAPRRACSTAARSMSAIKQALVVPGSGLVKRQAEAEGLDRIFIEAGFEWREPGCSMCLAMNPDKVPPGERCASTSNRNFVGRQGPGARTHLLSPAMAAAAAVTGRLTDVRELVRDAGSWPHDPDHARRGPRLSARPLANVDTDLIIPAEHLKTISRAGLGAHAFETLRDEPGNVFDDPAIRRRADPDRAATISAAARAASMPPGRSPTSASRR